MARKVQVIETVTITDDLDNKELPEDAKPTYFGWGGRRYEIFLSDAHYQSLEKALTKYVEAAKDVTTQARAASQSTSSGTRAKRADAGTKSKFSSLTDEEKQAVRAFGIEQGKLKDSGRGRVPDSLVDDYYAANK